MAIALDLVTQTTMNASGTFSHAVTGANRALFVVIHLRTATSGDSVSITYGGVSMTNGHSIDFASSGSKKCWIFYLVNPASGSNTVSVTFTGAAESVITAISFTGVNQANPVSANKGTASTTSGTSLSANITTITPNSWILDALNEGGSTPFTPGSGQTQQWGAATTVNGMTGYGSTKPTTSAGATSTSWTFTGGATTATLISVEVQPTLNVNTNLLQFMQ